MTEELPRDLGDGLTLRQATAEDTDVAAEFQAQAHLPHTFAESFRIWTRDLMSGALPGFQPGDFTVVEDTRSGAIVSMLNLIRAWYVRVPDIAGFLRQVTPVLGRRLADSAAAGYGGRLTIGFVDHGLDLLFDNGRVTAVERLARPGGWQLAEFRDLRRILPRAGLLAVALRVPRRG